MKNGQICRALIVAIGLGLGGCQRKAQPLDELEKTAAALRKVDPEAAVTAPAQDAAAAPSTQLQQAIVDYKAGKMEDAVTRLQVLRMSPAMSPEQRMALQDSVAAVMSEVYELARKGDARAIAAVQAYERMQNRQ